MKAKTPAKLGVLLTIALTAAACGGGDDGGGSASGSGGGGGGELKIGVINPFSGPNAPGGDAIMQGYEIAADEANADGGVNGRQITLVKGDASAPEQGISEVNRLATSENVDMFAGTYLSGVSNTASETALRYGKLYWETNGLATDLTERKLANFIRSGPSSAQFGQIAGDAMEKVVPQSIGKDIKGLKVCVTHEESIYGTSISDIVDQRLEKLGAQVTATVPYSPSAPDLGNVILKCQQGSPDVWVETGYVPDVNLLLRTAQQQGFTPAARVLIGSGDTRLTLDAVTADVLNGTFVVGYPHFDIQKGYAPGAADFLAAYKKKNGSEPTFPQTLAAYTGMKMLIDALDEAKSTDPAKVKKVVADWDKKLGTYPAGFGAKFDDTFQNTLALPTVTQWQGDKSVTVYPEKAKLPDAKVLGPQ